LPSQFAVPAGGEMAVGDAPRRLSSLPQAVNVPTKIAVANATIVSAPRFLSSLTDLAS
jgi:hypothetical protein